MKPAILTLLIVGSSLAAQQITLVPPAETDIPKQRRLLEQAWQQWEASDAGLERSLFTAPADRVLARIERGRQHAIAYHQQRARFLESVLGALQRELDRFQDDDQPIAPAWPAPDPRKLDVLLEEQKRLARQARRAGLSLLEQRSLAEAESLLPQLAENLAAQQRLYEAFKDNEAHSRKARRALVESYRTLLQLLKDQLRLNEDKRRLWLDYYDYLRQLVEAGQSQATPAKASRSRERK
jgi:hypothetical protein